MSDLSIDNLWQHDDGEPWDMEAIGAKPLREWLACPECGGDGLRWNADTITGDQECPHCNGSGLDPNKVITEWRCSVMKKADEFCNPDNPRTGEGCNADCVWVLVIPIGGNDE